MHKNDNLRSKYLTHILLRLNHFSFVFNCLESPTKRMHQTPTHASSSGHFRGERDSGRRRRASAAAREPTRPAARFTSALDVSRQDPHWPMFHYDSYEKDIFGFGKIMWLIQRIRTYYFLVVQVVYFCVLRAKNKLNRWCLSIDLLQGSLQRLFLFQPLLETVSKGSLDADVLVKC